MPEVRAAPFVNPRGEHFSRCAGLRVEALGESWLAYSPLSGETMVLNDESAAILEVLEPRPTTLPDICAELASDTGDDPRFLMASIAPIWSSLIEAGLVVQSPPSAT